MSMMFDTLPSCLWEWKENNAFSLEVSSNIKASYGACKESNYIRNYF